MSAEFIPPQDGRAEDEVLGAMLLRDGAAAVIVSEIGLRAEDLYLDSNRILFAAMAKLAGEGTAPTEIAVVDALGPERLAKVGGRDRVASLPGEVRSPGNYLHHASIIRDKARWRRRLTAGQEIREAAVIEDGDAFARAQGLLADEPTHERAMHDADRQRDLVFELIEGKAKAEFFWPLDKLNRLQSGGMRRGQLIVLSGYTNEGKSHFAAQLLDLNRKHGRVCLYDNEMDPVEQAARRVSRLTGVSYGRLLDGALDDFETRKVMDHLNSDLSWPIVDTAGWTVEEVALHIRQNRWDFVVIDILHNFPFENEREIAASVARLKAAARLANCCIVLVAHVNRGGIQSGMRRRPVRSDLRWSGEIENLADAVCFVYREQDPDTFEPTPDGFIYLDKCRGGKLGGQAVSFDSDRLRFLARDLDEPISDISISRMGALA